MSIEQEIKDCIKDWDKAESPKPRNDERFINLIACFIESRDKDCFEFKGENHYCGSTAIVFDDYCSFGNPEIAIEIAYSKGMIKVFTAHHNGFWTPEYIDLSGDDAKSLLESLKKKFLEWGDFNE